MATEFETQVRHMNFLRDAKKQNLELATSVDTRQFEEITEITIIAPDHPRLLSIIAGACVTAGGNIVDAKIHTTTDGRALDSIFINRVYDKDREELHRGQRIGKTIEEILSGKASLENVISRSKTPRNRHKAFSIPAKVEVNNALSDTFSVIEIECLDRPGLLSELTGVLADLNLDIGSAHIITFGEKANDSFYVRDLVGHKIEDPVRIERIRQALLKTMLPESQSPSHITQGNTADKRITS